MSVFPTLVKKYTHRQYVTQANVMHQQEMDVLTLAPNFLHITCNKLATIHEANEQVGLCQITSWQLQKKSSQLK